MSEYMKYQIRVLLRLARMKHIRCQEAIDRYAALFREKHKNFLKGRGPCLRGWHTLVDNYFTRPKK